VETCGPKGIRIHWGVPTFHGAASQTSRRGIPGGGFLVSGVPGRVKSRLGSPPSWGSRGRTSERSGPGVPRRPQSAGRPQGRDPIQSLAATLSYMQSTWNPRTWIHVDPMAFNVERGSGGHGGKGWGLSRAMEPLCLHFPGDPTVLHAWEFCRASWGRGHGRSESRQHSVTR
jgi:hypothetical protein